MAVNTINTTGTLRSSKARYILLACLLVATLDMSGALVVWTIILKKVTATQILQGIASGVFADDAFSGDPSMAWFGILFHYIIASSFTIFYFLIYPYVPFLRKQRILSGLLYGVFVWAFMNYAVLPFSHVRMSPFRLSSAMISAAILMVCIGLPVSWLTSRYYDGKS
jgi:hypothetical protein